MRIRVCADSELGVGEARRLDTVPPIAVIRGESGAVYAIDDTCTHAEASLAEGYVEDDTVECPLHRSVFCLKTGAPSCPPAAKPVRTHAVLHIDGDLYVEVTPMHAATPKSSVPHRSEEV